jgi:ribonucleoside-triphosphate reductase
MYILMCGTGVGFSCERQVIASLPIVGEKTPRKIYERTNENFPGVDPAELSTFNSLINTIIVADSKYGWASALRILIVELYNGNFDIQWDTSLVRAAGTPLKTFGGRASGPEPLDDLFRYAANLFRNAVDRKLTSIEVHGLVCKIAEIVVVGGVRRSALISLSNLSDDRMRYAKTGQFGLTNPEYYLANNSVAYDEKPEVEIFMREWLALVESKSGERGIFNREASQIQAAKNGRRDPCYEFGTNPCSEIILRDRQFCNLSEVVVRATDEFEDLERKVINATILGTLQATLTDFIYLSPKWKENTEEEALLGVSLTGIMDHPILSGSENGWFIKDDSGHRQWIDLAETLERLKDTAIETNKIWADRLGINHAAAITCVKPSGTVSQLTDAASGIHARHAPYYIRRVRADIKDPLAKFMKDKGFPWEPAVSSPETVSVFSFPIKAPESSIIFRDDRTAIEQLEHWLTYQRHWCEHKPSISINIKDHEWLEAGAWVYEHFDEMSGVSFFPHDGGSYEQAPYEDITKEQYEVLLAKMPKDVDWTGLGEYETEDHTTAMKAMACTGNVCEIVDLTK